MENQNKFETFESLTRALILDARLGGFDKEITTDENGVWNKETGKIVYGFKSCVHTKYKKLMKFCEENNIKTNLVVMKQVAFYKLVTNVYYMEEDRVMEKKFWWRGFNNTDNGKDHTNYIVEINFNDLYRD